MMNIASFFGQMTMHISDAPKERLRGKAQRRLHMWLSDSVDIDLRAPLEEGEKQWLF